MKLKKHILSLSMLLLSSSSFATDTTSSPNIISCDSPYALCISSNCIKTKDGKNANCQCPVYAGDNVGGTVCAKRNSAVKDGQIYSDYSPIHNMAANAKFLPGKKFMNPTYLCPTDGPDSYVYADCMDVKCDLSGDGKTANCTCPLISDKKLGDDVMMLVVADNCAESSKLCQHNTSGDTKVVVNSAPIVFGTRILVAGMSDYKISLSLSDFCVNDRVKKNIAELLKQNK